MKHSQRIKGGLRLKHAAQRRQTIHVEKIEGGIGLGEWARRDMKPGQEFEFKGERFIFCKVRDAETIEVRPV